MDFFFSFENNDEQNKKNTTTTNSCFHSAKGAACISASTRTAWAKMFSSAKHSNRWSLKQWCREKSPPCGLPMATTSIIYLQFVKQLQEAPLRLIQVHTQNTKYKRATKKNWGAFSWLSTGSVVKDLQWAQAPQAFQCLLSLLLELLQHWALAALPALPLAESMRRRQSHGWGHRLRPMLAELPASHVETKQPCFWKDKDFPS